VLIGIDHLVVAVPSAARASSSSRQSPGGDRSATGSGRTARPRTPPSSGPRLEKLVGSSRRRRSGLRSGSSLLDNLGKSVDALLMKSTISSKGQITVPAEVREKLGLVPGTVVQFELREGGVLLRKGGPGAHPVDQVYGRLKLGGSVDALLDTMRGPRAAASRVSVRRPSARKR